MAMIIQPVVHIIVFIIRQAMQLIIEQSRDKNISCWCDVVCRYKDGRWSR